MLGSLPKPWIFNKGCCLLGTSISFKLTIMVGLNTASHLNNPIPFSISHSSFSLPPPPPMDGFFVLCHTTPPGVMSEQRWLAQNLPKSFHGLELYGLEVQLAASGKTHLSMLCTGQANGWPLPDLYRLRYGQPAGSEPDDDDDAGLVGQPACRVRLGKHRQTRKSPTDHQ